MANYSCYVCNGETGIKKGLWGMVEAKVQWCSECENKVNDVCTSLPNISKNKAPKNQSATILNLASGNEKLLKRCGVEIVKRLTPGESIIDFVSINNGTISLTGGMMVLTDKKFFLFTVTTSGAVGTRAMGCKTEYTTSLDNIVNIESNRGLQGQLITISDQGNRKIDKIYCQNVTEFEQFKSKVLNQELKSVNTVIQTNETNLDKIKKLKELLDMDVITANEFEEKKQKLLKDI